MFGLLAHQGVSSLPWSPLAKGRLARPWGEQTQRSENDDLQRRYDDAANPPIVEGGATGRRGPRGADGPGGPGLGGSPPRGRGSDRGPDQGTPPDRCRRGPGARPHRRRGRRARGAVHPAPAHRLHVSTHGISFPADPDGSRPTSRVAREVVAEALRPVDPVGARAAEQKLPRLAQPLPPALPAAGRGRARDGRRLAAGGGRRTDAVRRRVVGRTRTGTPPGLPRGRSRRAETRDPDGGRPGRPADRAVLPYRGQLLVRPRSSPAGDVGAGRRARAVGRGRRPRGRRPPGVAPARGPDRRRARRRRGDGPARTAAPLGRDRRRRGPADAGDLGARARTARAAAGRLLVPDAPGTEKAGVDLLAEVPETADWLAGLDGRLVVGNYLYADGGTHVRVSVAADGLASRVTAYRRTPGSRSWPRRRSLRGAR